jgi:hypothetical protein
LQASREDEVSKTVTKGLGHGGAGEEGDAVGDEEGEAEADESREKARSFDELLLQLEALQQHSLFDYYRALLVLKLTENLQKLCPSHLRTRNVLKFADTS